MASTWRGAGGEFHAADQVTAILKKVNCSRWHRLKIILNDTKIRELCEGPTYQNEIAGMIQKNSTIDIPICNMDTVTLEFMPIDPSSNGP